MARENQLDVIEHGYKAAVRWERIRAAYFTRTGKPENALKCKALVIHYEELAAEASYAKNRAAKRFT